MVTTKHSDSQQRHFFPKMYRSKQTKTKFLSLKGKNRLKQVKNCNKWRINIAVPTRYQKFAVTFGNDYEEINSHYRNILHSGIPDIMVAQLYTEILQDATNIIATVVVFRMDLKIFPSIYVVFNISVWPVDTAFSWQLCAVSGERRCAAIGAPVLQFPM